MVVGERGMLISKRRRGGWPVLALTAMMPATAIFYTLFMDLFKFLYGTFFHLFPKFGFLIIIT